MVIPSIYSAPHARLDHFDREYNSGTDCQVYINSVYLDEVASVRYQTHNSRTTTYGYHSEFADDIIEGKEIIQGVMAVYLVEDNYVGRKIRGEEDKAVFFKRSIYEYRNALEGGRIGIPEFARGLIVNQLGQAYVDSVDEIIAHAEIDEQFANLKVTQLQLESISGTVKGVLSANMPKTMEALQKVRESKPATSSGRGVKTFARKFDEFTLNEFNISIVTGYNQAETMMTTIRGCTLDAHSQVIRTTAEPLLAVYKFMGRNVEEGIYNG